MIREYIDKGTLGRFIMHINHNTLTGSGIAIPEPNPVNTFVYNKGDAQKVIIDEISYTMPASCILPLVSNQNFRFERPEALIAWQFNREFYCLLDHDKEVGCVGFLFYGIQHPMFIQLEREEIEEINHLEKVFTAELELKDKFQGEMLRTLLKRVIIKTTRAAKQQSDDYLQNPEEKLDLVRKFCLFVEGNFKQHHDVKFYADALHKSPKTLSNLFAILNQPAPSVLIRNRIILEAKRLLHYTDKSGKEIAFELGFENPSHFSKMFKKHTGTNISQYRG